MVDVVRNSLTISITARSHQLKLIHFSFSFFRQYLTDPELQAEERYQETGHDPAMKLKRFRQQYLLEKENLTRTLQTIQYP